MGSLGFPELLIIAVIVIFLFGAKRIPDLASGIGAGIRNFKKSMHEDPNAKTPEVATVKVIEESR